MEEQTMTRYKKIALITGGVIILAIAIYFVMKSRFIPTAEKSFDAQPTQGATQVESPSINIDFEEVARRNPDEVSEEEAQAVQSESDREFSQWQEEIYSNYPWYSSLPLQTSEYFVYLDLEKKAIFAILYQDQIPADQIDTTKVSIINQLSSLGINQILLDSIIFETE